MAKKYCIGLDFGTLSARAALVSVETGEEKASLMYTYRNAVIDNVLPESNVKILPDCAFQDPQDYLDALTILLSGIWKKANVDPVDIIGIGINFTSCTLVSLDQNMDPMCFNPKYRKDPQSWVKLWKHHGAQTEADRINQIAKKRNEAFLHRYGGQSSSEWMFAKALETLNKSPSLYQEIYCFMEAGDWLVYQLTGNVKKSTVFAGYKGFWHESDGYPSADFFKAVHPDFECVVKEKIRFEDKLYRPGTFAGTITAQIAEKTGLCLNTCVSVSVIDGHAAVPAVGMKEENAMLLVMGTSLCHMLVSEKYMLVDGICGVVKDGLLPGFYGYEAGQPAVGDMLAWFVNTMVNEDYQNEARKKNISVYGLLEEKAATLKVGQSGCLALDWWNGNRSVLSNSDLSGMVVGMTLTSKPEEIYRALIEAAAFGSRRILDEFAGEGIHIDKVYACGGLSQKSPFVVQVFSDILGCPIHVTDSDQTAALGSAMFAAVAAGEQNGGYGTLFEAINKMKSKDKCIYTPQEDTREVYNLLYEQYRVLHDYFGKINCETMPLLKKLRANCMVQK